MGELADYYGFSLQEEFPKHIYNCKFNNKGYFKNGWPYYFHGAECKFENISTGQTIEMIYITRPEFGYLDGYFLYNYMLTTDRFRSLGERFGDCHNVWIAIHTLAEWGVLTKDPLVSIQRNIIAFK